MPTLRSQSASSLTKEKRPSDTPWPRLPFTSPATPTIRSVSPATASPSSVGPATPAQVHESVRTAVVDDTPFSRRSPRLNAAAASVAACGGDVLENPDGSWWKGKGKRKAAVDCADQETGQMAAAFIDAANKKTFVGEGKGKRKAEESVAEAFCEITREKTDSAFAKVKSGIDSGGSSGEKEGRISVNLYSTYQENPDPCLSPKPSVNANENSNPHLRPILGPCMKVSSRGTKSRDGGGFVSAGRGRGRGRGRGQGRKAMAMACESFTEWDADDATKESLCLDLNRNPHYNCPIDADDRREEPEAKRQREVGQFSGSLDLDSPVEDNGDNMVLSIQLGQEHVKETAAQQDNSNSAFLVAMSPSQSEAGPSHRPQQEEDAKAEAETRFCHRHLGEAGPSKLRSSNSQGGRSRAEASRSKFLQIARDRAFHFAHFNADGNEAPAGAPPPPPAPDNGRRRGRQAPQPTPRQLQRQPQPQPQPQQVDWPGPFSTARKLVENRATAAAARQHASKSETKVSLVDWHPTRVPSDSSFARKPCPSLQDLCLSVLVNNAENVVSLEGVPESIRARISVSLCERRKMNSKTLSLFFQGAPTEIRVPNCTQVCESEMTEMMRQFSASCLEELHLGFCGRALSEQCLLATIAKPRSILPLKSISLCGAYRLTDKGLEALLQASPLVAHLDLSTCAFLTDAALKAVVRCAGDTLESLVLEGCPNINASVLVHDLVMLPKLQKLSLSAVIGVTDEVVIELSAQLGSHLRELSLAHCCSLTDTAIAEIGACCPSLQVLDLSSLSLLTDVAIAYIADGLRMLQVLNLRRCKFSDEAVAAFVTASGGSLLNLSVNSVQQVADQTILALAKHSHACLQRLNMSFCRLVGDECLGFLADSCPHLHELRLFGCTQVTEKFLKGHSNSKLKVVGL